MPKDTWAMSRAIRSPGHVRDSRPIVVGRDAYRWFAGVAATLVTSVPLTLLLPQIHASSAMPVAWCGVALLVSVILGYSVCRARPLVVPLLVAGQTGASSLVLLAALGWFWYGGAAIGTTLRLALAAAMLAWLITALAQLFRGHASPQACASWIILIFSMLGLAPLWGGAIVEALTPSGSGAGILIGISPITYLAQAAGWDYLRFDWVYRVTPLGGLRFEYPDFWLSSMFLGFLALAVQGLEAARWRLRPAGHRSPFNTSAT